MVLASATVRRVKRGDCVTQHKQTHTDTINMSNGSRIHHTIYVARAGHV